MLIRVLAMPGAQLELQPEAVEIANRCKLSLNLSYSNASAHI